MKKKYDRFPIGTKAGRIETQILAVFTAKESFYWRPGPMVNTPVDETILMLCRGAANYEGKNLADFVNEALADRLQKFHETNQIIPGAFDSVQAAKEARKNYGPEYERKLSAGTRIRKSFYEKGVK